MKKVLVFLTTGFEEIEALATIDILRRGEVTVQTISLEDSTTVIGSHKIPVIADKLFSDVNFSDVDMLILPGGTTRYNEHDGLRKELFSFYQSGKEVAAICASPMVLGGLGILKGKRATCYPGFEQYLEGATLETSKAVIIQGNITTGRGPGLTFDFALELLEKLQGKAKRVEVAKGMLLI